MIRKKLTFFLNRAHAAQQMISKLGSYRNMDCCIIATSNGGVAIGSLIAKRLNAELVFMPSEMIEHPSNPQKSLGVVGLDYVISHELERDIPQDFIYRRTRAIQSDLSSRYPDVNSPISSRFHDRVTIFVDDCLQNNEEILGCLRMVREQQPKEIVVAVPVVSKHVAEEVRREADTVMFLHVVSEESIHSAYLDLETINDAEIPEFMNLSVEEIIEDQLSRRN